MPELTKRFQRKNVRHLLSVFILSDFVGRITGSVLCLLTPSQIHLTSLGSSSGNKEVIYTTVM